MMSDEARSQSTARRRRLAIVGCGSSGLACLKYAIDILDDWDIICYEKSNRIVGCWGDPYPGFVSTSTKYTTQFACFAEFEAQVKDDQGKSRDEFFCNDEYGKYLGQFAETFALRRYIALQSQVDSLRRSDVGTGWELSITRMQGDESETTIQQFDSVILCTGLAAVPKRVDGDVKCLSIAELNDHSGLGQVTNQRIVVIGGGESAVDFADRLAKPELGNEVFLSLKSGIRVSPRYHPIRGVPSDFLRNRLMLSIHEDIRNWIGQRFVELRIRYQEAFERVFPKSESRQETEAAQPTDRKTYVDHNRKEWAYKLTKTAKDDLFNMFHNKSDDFLDAVAEGRIKIIGAPVDGGFKMYNEFDSNGTEEIDPDLVVPAVGYQSGLAELSAGQVRLEDFYLACCHVNYADLFLVGFARPIIGNIPTISEVQARYVCSLIDGEVTRPAKIVELHQADRAARRARYKHLNTDAVYPVEMFPYCDQLAKLMSQYPSMMSVRSLTLWCRIQLAPASTLHYDHREPRCRERCRSAPIYLPVVLIVLLLTLKPISLVYRSCRALKQKILSRKTVKQTAGASDV